MRRRRSYGHAPCPSGYKSGKGRQGREGWKGNKSEKARGGKGGGRQGWQGGGAAKVAKAIAGSGRSNRRHRANDTANTFNAVIDVEAIVGGSNFKAFGNSLYGGRDKAGAKAFLKQFKCKFDVTAGTNILLQHLKRKIWSQPERRLAPCKRISVPVDDK